MKTKLSIWDRVKAYRLKNNVIILGILIVIFVSSIILYMQEWAQKSAIWSNILLACFTSFLATILAMSAEIYVAFRDKERDQFLEDIHIFGIANLNKDKESLLRDLLNDCDKEIWISGYRLILTDHLKSDIAEAIKRGAKVTAVLCAPWTEAFKLVYGTYEKVMDNYFSVFHAIAMAKKESTQEFKILIVEKPIFSDTYRVDQNLVTGPYMHNKDTEYSRIMAKDFFSYNLVRKSRLYELVENEFLTLCDEAVLELNWERFNEAYDVLQVSDLTEQAKIELFKNACDPL